LRASTAVRIRGGWPDWATPLCFCWLSRLTTQYSVLLWLSKYSTATTPEEHGND